MEQGRGGAGDGGDGVLISLWQQLELMLLNNQAMKL